MKKKMFLLLGIATCHQAMAGGLFTNANQSASYVRMPSRDASTEVDAIYYNPAGISFIKNGLYISLNNQTIHQRKKIKNNLSLFNNRENVVNEYIGEVNVPIFPSLYGAYKHDKWSLGFGLQINAGGGSAEYSKGLPCFESAIAMLPLKLKTAGIETGKYDCEISFNGKSIFWGAQLNGSYLINENFSISVGGRAIIARNTYNGNIKNISVSPIGNVNKYFSSLASQAPNATIKSMAEAYASATCDKEVDVTQKGLSFAPILGIDYMINDKWNFGIKYEFKTKLTLKNATTTDNTGMFPDKLELRSDIPAILSVGVDFKPTNKIDITSGIHYYFDKKAIIENYTDGNIIKKNIEGNIFEIALGTEIHLTDKFLISFGGFYTQKGVDESYQSDMAQSLSSYTLGLGCAYKFNDNISVNLGAFNTFYQEDSKQIYYESIDKYATETYNRENSVIGIGIDYKF